jgi:hypothetical protein
MLDRHGFRKAAHERLHLGLAPGGYAEGHHTLRRLNGEHERNSIAGFQQKTQEGDIIPPDSKMALRGLQKKLTPLKPAYTGLPQKPIVESPNCFFSITISPSFST